MRIIDQTRSYFSQGFVESRRDQSSLVGHNNVLAKDFAAMETYQPKRTNLKAQWSNMKEPEQRVTKWDTGLPDNLLRYIGSKSVSVPDRYPH